MINPQPSSGRPTTLYLVHILTHATRSALDDALKPVGISAFHYTILRVISDHPGLSAAALSRRFYVTPQTIGEVLVLLEKRGLLDRSPNPENQRALALHLTEQGRAAVALGNKLSAEIEARIFSTADEGAIEVLRETIGRALATLRQP